MMKKLLSLTLVLFVLLSSVLTARMISAEGGDEINTDPAAQETEETIESDEEVESDDVYDTDI